MTGHPSDSGRPASDAGFLSPAPGLTLSRMGFGAMRLLSGSHGRGRDRRNTAIAVLQTAIELGITHIDTSDFYGPYVINELIAAALHPYPDDLRIVTKVGYLSDAGGGLRVAVERDDLRRAVTGNLERLRLPRLDVVNLRVDPGRGPISGPLSVLIELRDQGLIRHLGLSNVSRGQLEEAQSMTEIVCVQNAYNLGQRDDDPMLELCAEQGIAYVPFFPLGAGSLMRSTVLSRAAIEVGATPEQVALAWLLQRSPAILLIPGTSSIAHLRQNAEAAQIRLPAAVISALPAVG